jgi:hypothetical protein
MTRPQVRLNIRPNQPGSDSLSNYRQLKGHTKKILSQLDCKKAKSWNRIGFRYKKIVKFYRQTNKQSLAIPIRKDFRPIILKKSNVVISIGFSADIKNC